MNSETAYSYVEKSGIMAGMRGGFTPDVALRTANVLMEENINVLEFTMNSIQPIEAMQAVKAELGDEACVGMGTVLSVDDVGRVLDAGADFIVSPAFQPEIVQAALDADVLIAPGVITPSEAVKAWGMGVRLLKLFPVGAIGIAYFKAMFGPLNHMKYMCNGAMDDVNARQFIEAGAIAAGMAGWLTGDGTWTESKLRSRAHILRNSVEMARTGQPPAMKI